MGDDERAPLLEVRNLTLDLDSADGLVHALGGVSFTVDAGELLGVVGESGSGKTMCSLSIMGLIDRRRSTTSGEILFNGRDLLALSEKEMRDVRRGRIAMIYQDPFASLHPMYSIGAQIAEAVRVHSKMSRAAARDRAVELLSRVGVPHARERARDYPHQFSGGMRQRAMIAMALAHEPVLLIADEPTTALDVTVQAQILDLLNELRRELGMALLLVTHDLGVVADMADSVLVLYAGHVMEHGSATEVLNDPQHPYTLGLLNARPTVAHKLSSLRPIPGSPPSLVAPPSGCPFHPRCGLATPECAGERPLLSERAPGRLVACRLGPSEVRAAGEAAAGGVR